MKKFVDECPTPPPPHGDALAIPIKLVQREMKEISELQALRANVCDGST